MEVLKSKQIINGVEGEYLEGMVLMGSFSREMSKKNTPFFSGKFEADGSVEFKVWANSEAFAMFDSEGDSLTNKIVYVVGKVNMWGGFSSLIIEKVLIPTEEDMGKVTESDFLKTVYDAEKYMEVLTGIIEKNCSAEAVSVFNLLMNIPDVKERFSLEFAAKHMHDNVKSGLLAHSLKVTKLASMLVMYPELLSRIDKSVLFLGCAIHDIGKVFEYTNGTIVGDGQILSHNVFGVWLLANHEEEIVNLVGHEFFMVLMSIVDQHHGEYGSRPRTLAAYIIHMLDLVESQLTMLNTLVRNSNPGEQIRYDDLRLV